VKYFEKISEEQEMKFFEKVSREKGFDDLIAGSIGGGLSVLGTQPLHQVATKKVIEPVPVNATALRKFLHKWKGAGWRAAKGSLAAGISFGVYGQIKKMLDAN
jgi:hypothetical protein